MSKTKLNPAVLEKEFLEGLSKGEFKNLKDFCRKKDYPYPTVHSMAKSHNWKKVEQEIEEKTCMQEYLLPKKYSLSYINVRMSQDAEVLRYYARKMLLQTDKNGVHFDRDLEAKDIKEAAELISIAASIDRNLVSL